MEDEQLIKNAHRINLTIWIAIISFIVVLTMITFFIDSMSPIQPVEGANQINQFAFLLAVVLAFAILIFKRTLFMPEKILAKYKHESAELLTTLCLNQIRKNYIIEWAMGEAICILGFVNYILTANRQYFLVFAVVSIYSVLINMPRIALLKRCAEPNQAYS